MAAIDPSPKMSLAGLDLLRVTAAILVVGYHYFHYAAYEPVGVGGIRDAIGTSVTFSGAEHWASWGWVGAEIFFVISGFVITMSAVGKRAGDFAIDRAARLLPGLVFFATLSLVVLLSADVVNWSDGFERWLRSVILFPKGPWIDGVYWTLTIELSFYVAIYLLLRFGLFGVLPMLCRIAAAVLMTFWVLVGVNLFVFDLGPVGVALEYVRNAYFFRVLLITTGTYFLTGILAYEIHARGATAERLVVLSAMAVCSVAAIYSKSQSIGALAAPSVHVDHWLPCIAWLAACGLAAAFVWVERHRPPGPTMRRMCRLAGLQTYPLYLVHNVTGAWVFGWLLRGGTPPALAATVAIAFCLVFSYAFSTRLEPKASQWISSRLRRLTARGVYA